MGRTASAFAMGGFGEVQGMDFVGGEVEEMGLGKHQPWELWGQVDGGFGGGGSPALADASESEVVDVDCEIFRDCFEEFRRQLSPVRGHFRGFGPIADPSPRFFFFPSSLSGYLKIFKLTPEFIY